MPKTRKQHLNSNQRFVRRKSRTKFGIKSRDSKPRLSVFRSLKYISAQIIDDIKGVTLVAATEHELSAADKKLTKVERAEKIGAIIAKKAQEKKISQVAFDRSGYRYHGRVKALADAARISGLQF